MKPVEGKTNIVIVGYPKSGCTWLTRLVAELVECPVVGFLGSGHDEIAREGLNRESDFRCFKSHHLLDELREVLAGSRHGVIYIIRDPRDVALSGAHYFFISRWSALARFFSLFPHGREIYRKSFNFFVTPSGVRVERMVHAVLQGADYIHKRIRMPWIEHCRPYIDNRNFFVKYEDLLDHPAQECRRIFKHLGLERSDLQVHRAIENQSFARKKEEFLKNRDMRRAGFMRSGKKEEWRQKLSPSQKDLFQRMLKNDLARFGYPVEDDGAQETGR